MRRRWAVIAGLGIMLTSAGAFAQETPTTSRVLVLGERNDRPAPTIVRGTSAAPRPATAAGEQEGPRWQIVAGERLWLIDRATAEVRSCSERDTSTVGLREIRCTAGDLGRYSRTFGPNFHP
jgi:hypothetical protein